MNDGIIISDNTARSILNTEGIKSPKTKRKPKKHRRRKRREHEGELVQTDATPHDFFGMGEKVCLHGIIDDATGKILGLYITKHECLEGYMSVMEQMITNFGIPASIYTDRHAIFVSPAKGRLSMEDEMAGKQTNDTQLGRAIRELGITLITARSPQAKGRIERLWVTLQDRLTIEFRINGIADIHAANLFLSSYIPRYNQRFSVEASETASMFIPNTFDLTYVLCVRNRRKLDTGGAFSFFGKCFVVDGDIPPRVSVEVITHHRLGISVAYKGRRYGVYRIEKPKRQRAAQSKAPYIPPPRTPLDSSYHKHGKESYIHYSGEYSDRDMLAILDEIFSKSY